MNNPRNYLEPTAAERRKLRAHKIRLKEVHHHTVKQLQAMLDISKLRAMEFYALSEFQSLPSVGIRFAYDLIGMGFYSLKELKNKDGAKLLDQYEQQVGAWVDPCVEDQFRLAAHYAHHPDSSKNWWDFTKERKLFREKQGYPASRPGKPWYELPVYNPAQKVPAKNEGVKEDLLKRLRRAIILMRKKFSEPLSVKQMAEEANLSQYHFIRCFRSTYDVTPLQFLTHLRLKKASQLLRKTNQPINVIVPQCGFSDESAFGRLFKREFRVTPVVYRKARH